MGDFLDKTGLALVKTKIDTKLAGKLDVSLKGTAGGLAELDSNGHVFASQLPSYVDDVIEYQGMENFPTHGEVEKIYVDTLTGKTYRWGGTTYAEISESIAIGETSNTAYRGDRGKVAYDHAAAKGSAYAAGLYRITTNAEGHVIDASPVAASDITALGVPSSEDLEDYAPVNSPAFTGSISMGRDDESTVGANSVATGENVIAAGLRSHAEGERTSATGNNSHAEGSVTTALGSNSHAEGDGSSAGANASHAEGYNTTASGQAAHAEGMNVTASGSGSHAEGRYTVAVGASEHVSGQYNVADTANEWVSLTSYVVGDKVLHDGKIYECMVANEDEVFSSANWIEKGNYLVVVGNGNSNDSRSNAYSLDWDGNEHVKGDVFVKSQADGTGGTSLSTSIRDITRSGTTFTATRIDGTTFTFDQQDNNTTYSFSNSAPTLAWNTTSTIGTVGGVALTVKMPANPDTNTTYSFVDKNVTLKWGTTHTIATVGGTNIRLTMPGNPNTNTTYSFVNKGVTLAWNTTHTIATVGGVNITLKMPANPNTNTTYSFSNNNPTLAWGTKSTVGTVGGVALTVTMPGNPNTNTWRPVQNNLTSTSTTDCLSAYQGKLLNDKFSNYIPLSGSYITFTLSNGLKIKATNSLSLQCGNHIWSFQSDGNFVRYASNGSTVEKAYG